VCPVPPSRRTPNATSTALSDALAARNMTVTGSNAAATRWLRSARMPPARSLAMARATRRVRTPLGVRAVSAIATAEIR